MLTASLEDLLGTLQSQHSLVNATDGTVNQANFAAFQQLLNYLEIEPKWAGYIVDWIDPDIVPQNPDGAEDSVYMGQSPPYRTPNMYITSASEILALPGFGHDRYAKLAPYIVALPIDAKINICTASGLVLGDAFIPAGRREYSLDPDGLQKNRDRLPAARFPAAAGIPAGHRASRPSRRRSSQWPASPRQNQQACRRRVRHEFELLPADQLHLAIVARQNSTCIVFCTRTARATCAPSCAVTLRTDFPKIQGNPTWLTGFCSGSLAYRTSRPLGSLRSILVASRPDRRRAAALSLAAPRSAGRRICVLVPGTDVLVDRAGAARRKRVRSSQQLRALRDGRAARR